MSGRIVVTLLPVGVAGCFDINVDSGGCEACRIRIDNICKPV